jgi:hypothetical protein
MKSARFSSIVRHRFPRAFIPAPQEERFPALFPAWYTFCHAFPAAFLTLHECFLLFSAKPFTGFMELECDGNR